MQTYPIPQMGMEEAVDMQYRLVDLIHRHFTGTEILQAGDYGVVPELGRARFTAKVEGVLADLFEAEDAMLVRAAGSGAIRSALMALLRSGDTVVIHAAPVYATTAVTFRAMGLRLVQVDFNDLGALRDALTPEVACVYVQHSRQLLEDRYDLGGVIRAARDVRPDLLILVDDNYTVFQMPRLGCQLGADVSTFSLFKVLGPVGIGCVAGRAGPIARMREDAYSGGSKVQGPEAMDALKSIVFAPVMLALEAQVVDEIVRRLNNGEVPGVRRAFVSNHQERTALVELEQPVARDVINQSVAYGAAPYPVGSASRYEVSTMIYRLSRAMIEADPSSGDRFLRINPFRAGAETVIRVLRAALDASRHEQLQGAASGA